jgi:hypothetical protein
MFSSRLVEPSRHGTDQAINRDSRRSGRLVEPSRACSPRAYAQAATTHTTQGSLYPIQLSKHKQHTTSKEYIQVQDPSKHKQYSSDL